MSKHITHFFVAKPLFAFLGAIFSSSSDRDVPELSNAVESTVYEQDEHSSFFDRLKAFFSSSSSVEELDLARLFISSSILSS